jgi:hypothetical protein
MDKYIYIYVYIFILYIPVIFPPGEGFPTAMPGRSGFYQMGVCQAVKVGGYPAIRWKLLRNPLEPIGTALNSEFVIKTSGEM